MKTCYLCGDLNIDLLNFENHKKTKDFIESLFSIYLFPQINRPSRITEYSATLIDNIFTNDIASNKVNGLLISDVSDHLPIFSIIKTVLKTMLQKENMLLKAIEFSSYRQIKSRLAKCRLE